MNRLGKGGEVIPSRASNGKQIDRGCLTGK
jgi:hypothetical protein